MLVCFTFAAVCRGLVTSRGFYLDEHEQFEPRDFDELWQRIHDMQPEMSVRGRLFCDYSRSYLKAVDGHSELV